MYKFKILLPLFFATLLVISCKEQEDARRPIYRSGGSFLKESVKRNLKLNEVEEKTIDSLIKTMPDKEVFASKDGFWYYYEARNLNDTLTPKLDDIAIFNYKVEDLFGNIIYTEAELKKQQYYVDKQEIMIGLRRAIKILRKNETAVFYFPSQIAYGYLGDKNRIKPNIPLKCTITLTNFYKEIK